MTPKRVESGAATVNLVAKNPAFLKLYVEHFGVNAAELPGVLAKLHRRKLALGGQYETETHVLAKGEVVLVDDAGKPQIEVASGLPVSEKLSLSSEGTVSMEAGVAVTPTTAAAEGVAGAEIFGVIAPWGAVAGTFYTTMHNEEGPSPAATPEPASVLVMAAGIGGFAALRKRRR